MSGSPGLALWGVVKLFRSWRARRALRKLYRG